MNLFNNIIKGVISFGVVAGCLSMPAFAEAKSYDKYSAKNAVQHIFFKDHYRSNRLNAHLVRVDLNNPYVNVDIALAYNNTNRKGRT